MQNQADQLTTRVATFKLAENVNEADALGVTTPIKKITPRKIDVTKRRLVAPPTIQAQQTEDEWEEF